MSGGKSLNTLFTLNLICGFVFFLCIEIQSFPLSTRFTHIRTHFQVFSTSAFPRIAYRSVHCMDEPYCMVHSGNVHRNTPHFTDHNPQSVYCSTSNQSARVHNTHSHQSQSSIIMRKGPRNKPLLIRCDSHSNLNRFVYNITHRHRLFLFFLFGVCWHAVVVSKQTKIRLVTIKLLTFEFYRWLVFMCFIDDFYLVSFLFSCLFVVGLFSFSWYACFSFFFFSGTALVIHSTHAHT